MLRALIALLLFLPAVALAGSNTVAVLYFKNNGNEQLDPLKVGLADMMIADIQGEGPYKVVERAELEAILDELELSRSDVADPEHAVKVGKLLGAHWFVTGSYSDVVGNFQIAARLFNTETSETVWAEVVHGRTKDFVEMEQRLSGMVVSQLTAHLGATAEPAPAPSPTPAEPVPGRRGEGESGKAKAEPAPSATAAVVREDADTMAAAISFSEGLIYMDDKDVERARDSFEKAVAQDPGFEAAKTKLASLDL